MHFTSRSTPLPSERMHTSLSLPRRLVQIAVGGEGARPAPRGVHGYKPRYILRDKAHSFNLNLRDIRDLVTLKVRTV